MRFIPLFIPEYLQLSMILGRLCMESADVIARRSQMLAAASIGKLPYNDPEFIRMWQEKYAAALQAAMILGRFTPQIGNLNSRLLLSTLKPYSRRVKANSKRLRRKRSRP